MSSDFKKKNAKPSYLETLDYKEYKKEKEKMKKKMKAEEDGLEEEEHQAGFDESIFLIDKALDFIAEAEKCMRENRDLEKEIEKLQKQIAEEKESYNKQLESITEETKNILDAKSKENHAIEKEILAKKQELNQYQEWLESKDVIVEKMELQAERRDQLLKEEELFCRAINELTVVIKSLGTSQPNTSPLFHPTKLTSCQGSAASIKLRDELGRLVQLIMQKSFSNNNVSYNF